MGGVSSSRLVKRSDDCAVFEGRLRSDGGGFCGQRMKLLSTPLDLSKSTGLYIDCAAEAVGADPSKRVWKVAMRTKQDRGEVVYQTQFTPPPVGERAIVPLPFEKFRLVRGPRLVPGVPPLTAAKANETYQISIVVSKFAVSETGAALDNFVEGPFAMRLHAVGTFGEDEASAAASQPAVAAGDAASMPRALTEQEQKAAAPLMVKLLRPFFGVLFGEPTRRRRAAERLLQGRGSSYVARARLGWAWRAAAVGPIVAAQRTAALSLSAAAAVALSLPIRLLFKIVVLASKTTKRVKRVLGAAPDANAASAQSAA